MRDEIKNKMINLLNKFDIHTHIVSELYPDHFIYQLINILEQLHESYFFNFKRQLFIVNNYYTINKDYLDMIKKYINEKNIDWCTKNKLKRIDDVNRL